MGDVGGRLALCRNQQHLVEVCGASLRRLKLDQISLYQFHRPDPAVPLEDSLGTLVRLEEEGKIRHIGLSNVNEKQLRQARQLTPIVSVQNRYNASDRGSESMVGLCGQEQMVLLPWASIQNLDTVGAKIAQKYGVTPRRVVLARMLARSPAMLPIPGTGSVGHLDENIAAAALKLGDDEVAELEPPVLTPPRAVANAAVRLGLRKIYRTI